MTQVPDNIVLLGIAWQPVELLDLNAHPHAIAAGGLVMAKAGEKPRSISSRVAHPAVVPRRWIAPAQ